jgi:hypothetical protein
MGMPGEHSPIVNRMHNLSLLPAYILALKSALASGCDQFSVHCFNNDCIHDCSSFKPTEPAESFFLIVAASNMNNGSHWGKMDKAFSSISVTSSLTDGNGLRVSE